LFVVKNRILWRLPTQR